MVRHPKRPAVIEPRKLMLAVLFELVVIGLGAYGYFQTENVLMLIGAVVIGSAPVLWVVLTASTPSQPGDIVTDGRRNRRR